MATIEDVGAREILDSRGNPTVEVEVLLDASGRIPGQRGAVADAKAWRLTADEMRAAEEVEHREDRPGVEQEVHQGWHIREEDLLRRAGHVAAKATDSIPDRNECWTSPGS